MTRLGFTILRVTVDDTHRTTIGCPAIAALRFVSDAAFGIAMPFT
jgi:hypothetical protein